MIRREDIRAKWLTSSAELKFGSGGALAGSTIIGGHSLAVMKTQVFSAILLDEASTVTFSKFLVAP